MHEGILTVNLNVKPKLTGAFKTSHKGKVTLDEPTNSKLWNKTLCVKQLYHRGPDGGIKRRPGRSEAETLFQECRCLDWAAILLKITYNFISDQVAALGAPLFEIPQLRFVHSAFAVSNDSKEKSFLIEEWIDASEDPFLKYINNSMAVSCVPGNAAPHIHERAEFLCFAQHVQWRNTGYLAFTSDFQGQISRPTLMSSNAHNMLKVPEIF